MFLGCYGEPLNVEDTRIWENCNLISKWIKITKNILLTISYWIFKKYEQTYLKNSSATKQSFYVLNKIIYSFYHYDTKNISKKYYTIKFHGNVNHKKNSNKYALIIINII